MLPFFLYAATGAVAAYHICSLLILAAYGVPQTLWEFVAFILSVCLVACAYFSLYKPSAAAKIALLAALGMWGFYGPAIAATIKAGRLTQIAKIHGAALPCAAILLLLLTTVYSFVASGKKTDPARPATWLFPARAGRWQRLSIILATFVAFIALSTWFAKGLHTSQRPGSTFLIPDGYVGWIHIDFKVSGAPPAISDGGQLVFEVPVDGKLKTSSPERFGWANDEYFSVSASGRHQLMTSARDGRMIWGKINGERGDASAPQQYEEFFVGNEQQFRESAGNHTPGPAAPAHP